MIPSGLTPADDRRAATEYGLALSTFRRVRRTLRLPPPLSRPGAQRTLWAAEHLAEARAGLPLSTGNGDAELDLLDYTEAWEAMPTDERPTWYTWTTYLSEGKGPTPDLPADDSDRGVGVDLWYRRTATAWPSGLPGAGGGPGRPVGAADRQPRRRDAPLYAVADERLARTRQLLKELPGLTGNQLGPELGVTDDHARRLIRQAKKPAAPQ
ncbi:hypothetical protein ACFQ0M_48655 [Kitasatospora aburaviensis]|uniref:DNA-binding protein n=1 Tax=Kitasatospora aburaviensis TaxID=67265 RepID=A0ABW1F4G8_9ACTN